MRILGLLFLIVLVGCGGSETMEDEMGAYQANPNDVPKDIQLTDPKPIIVARFEASDSGYTLTAFRSNGTPSSQIIKDRDVVVKALDGSGKELFAVSVENPRAVRTTGARDPETAVLDKATFTVFIPFQESIKSLEVNVIRGPNAEYKQLFEVDPKQLKDLPEDSPDDNGKDDTGTKEDRSNDLTDTKGDAK